MTNLPWFRFYSEALSDRKIARAVRASGQPKAVVMGVWLVLLCLANDSPERGKLMIGEDLWLDEDEVIAETGLDPVTFAKVISAFQQLNMVAVGRGYELPNWGKRQYKSDSSAARVAAHRERKKQEETAVTEGVTLQKRYSNAIDTDTEQIQNRTEAEAAAAVFAAYEQLCGIGSVNKRVGDELGAFIDEVGAAMCIEAIEEAGAQNVRKWPYIRAILTNWRDNGKGSGKRAAKPDVSVLFAALNKSYKEARAELEQAGAWTYVERLGPWEDLKRKTQRDLEFAWRAA